MNRRDAAQSLLDDELAKGAIASFINATMKDVEDTWENKDAAKLCRGWIEAWTDVGFNHIVTTAGSPLERVFLLSLLLGFIKWHPTGVVWTPAFDEDVEGVIETYRSDHVDALKAIETFKADHPRAGLGQMVVMLGDAMKQFPDEAGGIGALQRHVFEEVFHTWDKFHITPQPKMTRIRVDGRSIRPDALAWIPSDPSYKVILECDGYDYHADKVQFTNDRRRDRVLACNGYKVMRFSGHEVFDDAISTAVEAYDFMVAQRKDAVEV